MAQRKKRQTKTRTVTIAQAAATKAIRCVALGRFIVSAPSGTQYKFERGQVQQVLAADYDYLLSMERKSNACCGGKSSMVYFEEVD